MKTLKITNPLWVGELGPRIQKFIEIIKPEGITFPNFHAFLCQVVQFGKESSELWVVLDDEQNPLAFAQWNVRPLPYIGCVEMPWIYNWSKNRKATEMLYEEFMDFGRKWNAPYLMGIAANDKLAKHYEHIFTNKNVEGRFLPYKFLVGREIKGEN